MEYNFRAQIPKQTAQQQSQGDGITAAAATLVMPAAFRGLQREREGGGKLLEGVGKKVRSAVGERKWPSEFYSIQSCLSINQMCHYIAKI